MCETHLETRVMVRKNVCCNTCVPASHDMKHVIRKDRAEQLRREKKEKERIVKARKDKIKERRAAHRASDVSFRRTSAKVCDTCAARK